MEAILRQHLRVIGGRSAAHEGELKKAREIAFRELEQAALDAGPTPSSGSI